jgi:hypothetical protein
LFKTVSFPGDGRRRCRYEQSELSARVCTAAQISRARSVLHPGVNEREI